MNDRMRGTLGAAVLSLALLAPHLAHAEPTPLSRAELAQTRGGVVTSVAYPTGPTVSYTQNVQLDADVQNGFNQATTTLYLHHGTTKTGYRTVATPAPGYAGSIQTRFSMLGGAAKDLVIKYIDPTNGVSYVSNTVPDQSLHTSVRLRKLVFHNVKTTLNETNVTAAPINDVVDSRAWDWSLATVASMDAILATCPENKRTQVGFLGNDSGLGLHTVTTGTDNCANLQNDITMVNGNPQFNAKAQACMVELNQARLAYDPGTEAVHFFIVKDLPGTTSGLKGFVNATAQAVIIQEDEFSEAPWWIASLLTHELGHALGLSHTNVGCNGATPAQRNVMCSGSTAGKLLTQAQCDTIYDVPGLVDHN